MRIYRNTWRLRNGEAGKGHLGSHRNIWESIGILGSIGIHGNLEAGKGHLGSHKNTWESIGIRGGSVTERLGKAFAILFSTGKNPIMLRTFGDFFNIDLIVRPNMASPGKTTMSVRTGLQKRSMGSSQKSKTSILKLKRIRFKEESLLAGIKYT